ncbi:MAG: hypothetical protein MRY21_01620 [Simkaniaceae bacterium]|nr:hypothetical protein [Simkaniaceae bacterium]
MIRFLFLTLILTANLSALRRRPLDLHSQAERHAYRDKSGKFKRGSQSIIDDFWRLEIPGYPNGYNPSIIDYEGGYLLVFRDTPDMINDPWVSYIACARLNHKFQIVGSPQRIPVRGDYCSIQSQAEDARIFKMGGDYYLIYNDNMDIVSSLPYARRDMYLAKLVCENGVFSVEKPIKLRHPQRYYTQKWEKNWVPFVKNDRLFFSYSIVPHEVLSYEENCRPVYLTGEKQRWKWGAFRGGSPAIEVKEGYLSFFHTSEAFRSPVSRRKEMMHYYMGAAIYSKEPPFVVTHISPYPLMAKNLYAPTGYWKRVIYPGGFVEKGRYIYLVYGKDDSEIWIAKINKEELLTSLIPFGPS